MFSKHGQIILASQEQQLEAQNVEAKIEKAKLQSSTKELKLL